MPSRKVPTVGRAIGTDAGKVSADELIAQLGRSIESRDLRAAMKTLRLEMNPKALLDVEGYKYEALSTNAKQDVSLTFDGYHRYLREYGEPLSISDKTSDELVLVMIELNTDRVALPHGLSLRDPSTSIISKLGRKPSERSSDVSYGQAWWFQFDEYRLLAALDKKLRLMWLRVFRLTSNERAKLRLKRHLNRQNANINPKSAKSILALRKKLPTVAWQRRMAGGDTAFTKAGIQATATLLQEYLQTVADHASKKKAANIHNSVKRVVRSLNQINARHAGFIETLEREELCAFIDGVVRATGLEVVGDLTEEWRDW